MRRTSLHRLWKHVLPLAMAAAGLIWIVLAWIALSGAGLALAQETTGEGAPATATVIARPAMRKSVLTAFTRPRRTMTLAAEESARCQAVLADVGDTLGDDGVFARLDTTFIELKIAANRASQEQLKREIEYNRKQMTRYKQLVSSQNAAQHDLDNWTTKLLAAEEQLNGLEIEERILREHLARYTISGPPDWKVVKRMAEPGEWITAGQTVAELGDFRTLLVPIALTPGEYAWLKDRKGPIMLTASDSGREVEATVELVSPDYDPETRKINVDLEVDGGLDEMRGGIRMELEVDLPDETGGVVLPAGAVQERYEEFFVTPAEPSDGREPVRVTVLGRTADGGYKVKGRGVRSGMKFKVIR